ncbi:MAG: hypothetical protein ACRC3Y_05475, partial [Romboutsia sp.]|uniref:hypothetical protein n=1 Tax=Romboutsia sp. TaxID=1965302 RepID=UPI003F41747B
MNKLESLKLFKDLELASNKYRNLVLEDNDIEFNNNNKLNSLILHYQSRIDDIKKRSNFISSSTREELKECSSKDIYKLLVDLNSFAYKKYSSIKNSNISCTSFKAVVLTTVDEL